MMTLAEAGGGLPFDPLKAPWWWARIVSLWQRVKSIREAAAYDPEKLPAPKDIWLDSKRLESWYEEREELRKHRSETYG